MSDLSGLSPEGLYRSFPGPPGAATVVLLHGWTSTADVTWHGVYAPLSRHFPVIAPDLRGHGGGPRGGAGAGLADVASDVIDLMQSLNCGPAILVGYSLGGVVAQIVARARPDLLHGVVLCASACRVCDPRTGRVGSAVLKAGAALTRLVPEWPVRRLAAGVMRAMFGNSQHERWTRARTSVHRWSDVLSIGADLMSFDSGDWIEELTVPAAVVITSSDRFVSPADQRSLSESIAAVELSVDGDHSACLAQPAAFAAALIQACQSVASAEVLGATA